VMAVRSLATGRFRVQSQNSRITTLVGMGKFPFIHVVILCFLAFFFVIPAIIYWVVVVRKVRKVESIAVTTTPAVSQCAVHVSYPKSADKMVQSFLASLPKAQTAFSAVGR
jgi:hypothetical protein